MTCSANSTYICLCLFNVLLSPWLNQVPDWVPAHVGVKSNVENTAISWLTFNHHGNEWAESDCSPEGFQWPGCKEEEDGGLSDWVSPPSVYFFPRFISLDSVPKSNPVYTINPPRCRCLPPPPILRQTPQPAVDPIFKHSMHVMIKC